MGSTRPVEKPISPELALVDPGLAARARASLPDPPWLLPVLSDLQAKQAKQAEQAVPPAALSERVVREAAPEPAPWRSIASYLPGAATIALLLLVVTVLAISLLPPSNGPSFATETLQGNATAPARTVARLPRTVKPKRKARRNAKPKVEPPATRARTKPKSAAHRPAKKHSAKAKAKPALRTLTTAQRAFHWPRVPSAVYYELRLERGGTSIYVLRTPERHATLPIRLRLRPGTYHVLVRPGLPGGVGITIGAAILERTFKV